VEHLNWHDAPLHDAIGEAISNERAARRKEVETAIAEEWRAFKAKLAALEQRIAQRDEHRITPAQRTSRHSIVPNAAKLSAEKGEDGF
jgi:hypothetical protein